MQHPETTLVAIDPGLSGGVAVRNGLTGEITGGKMPQTLQEMDQMFAEFAFQAPVFALMEDVGKHRMGNSARSSTIFARHVGHLEMGLVSHIIPHTLVLPSKWMNDVAPGRPKGMESAQVRARKRFIKDLMQKRYPSQKVIDATADAFGILTYMITNKETIL